MRDLARWRTASPARANLDWVQVGGTALARVGLPPEFHLERVVALLIANHFEVPVEEISWIAEES